MNLAENVFIIKLIEIFLWWILDSSRKNLFHFFGVVKLILIRFHRYILLKVKIDFVKTKVVLKLSAIKWFQTVKVNLFKWLFLFLTTLEVVTFQTFFDHMIGIFLIIIFHENIRVWRYVHDLFDCFKLLYQHFLCLWVLKIRSRLTDYRAKFDKNFFNGS